MADVVLDRLKITKGAEFLTLYEWNTKTAKHYFCRVCGIYTHHQRRSDPTKYAFNVACVAGIDPFALGEIRVGNGAGMSLEPS